MTGLERSPADAAVQIVDWLIVRYRLASYEPNDRMWPEIWTPQRLAFTYGDDDLWSDAVMAVWWGDPTPDSSNEGWTRETIEWVNAQPLEIHGHYVDIGSDSVLMVKRRLDHLGVFRSE